MPVEIEAKMPLRDVAVLEARLAQCGAALVTTFFEVNTYYDTPERTLRTLDQGLRLRVARQGPQAAEGAMGEGVEEVATLTHKGPRAHGMLKSRTETEAIVADADAAADFLGALGYVAVLSFEKRRRRWQLDGCHVDLDTLPCLGDFVEVEGPDEDSVLAVRTRLGLDTAPIIRSSYISMLVSHLSERKMNCVHVGFDPSESAASPA